MLLLGTESRPTIYFDRIEICMEDTGTEEGRL